MQGSKKPKRQLFDIQSNEEEDESISMDEEFKFERIGSQVAMQNVKESY